MAVASVQAPVPGRSPGEPAHLGDPLLELREEQLVRHGDGKLQALHGLGAFVSGFQLRVHPFLAEEAGAIFRDAVAAHEAHGFAHHVGAVAGVPELAGGTEHVGLRIEHGEADQRIGFQLLERGSSSRSADGLGGEPQPLDGLLPGLGQRLEGGAAGEVLLGQEPVFFFLERLELVKEPGGGKTQRGTGFAGGPDLDQALQDIFLLLEAQFIARACLARLRRRGNAGAGT